MRSLGMMFVLALGLMLVSVPAFGAKSGDGKEKADDAGGYDGPDLESTVDVKKSGSKVEISSDVGGDGASGGYVLRLAANDGLEMRFMGKGLGGENGSSGEDGTDSASGLLFRVRLTGICEFRDVDGDGAPSDGEIVSDRRLAAKDFAEPNVVEDEPAGTVNVTYATTDGMFGAAFTSVEQTSDVDSGGPSATRVFPYEVKWGFWVDGYPYKEDGTAIAVTGSVFVNSAKEEAFEGDREDGVRDSDTGAYLLWDRQATVDGNVTGVNVTLDDGNGDRDISFSFARGDAISYDPRFGAPPQDEGTGGDSFVAYVVAGAAFAAIAAVAGVAIARRRFYDRRRGASPLRLGDYRFYRGPRGPQGPRQI